MENVQVIHLDENSKCSIDCVTHGFSITGPATLVVVKEAAVNTTADFNEDSKLVAIQKGYRGNCSNPELRKDNVV
ncbi:hypothetical protein ABH14_14840 [Brevibacillus brevis]|uniref:hypothetical protein n=1 Tax=Brevibacillus brevis TaxID=1393 RepID=UPI001902391C|nr:hypothetical protein [Brevibacillus brevis]MBH0331065.1 hypothetical protein [Brevibacillus brevis]